MATLIEILAGAAVEVVVFGVAGGVLYRVWRSAHFLPQRKTLMPFNKGVVLEGERVVRVLDPGSHWIKPSQTIVAVDVRPRPFQTAYRDLPTLDAQGVRIRLQGEYKVVDAALFLRESSDGHSAFYLSLDRVISLSIAEAHRTELLSNRGAVADRIRERIEPRAAQLGISIIHIEVSDMIPFTWAYSPNQDQDS